MKFIFSLILIFVGFISRAEDKPVVSPVVQANLDAEMRARTQVAKLVKDRDEALAHCRGLQEQLFAVIKERDSLKVTPAVVTIKKDPADMAKIRELQGRIVQMEQDNLQAIEIANRIGAPK